MKETMTKEEAVRRLESINIFKADPEEVNFLRFWASGGLHKAIKSGKTIEDIFQMAESHGVVFSDEVKNCMRVIFS